MEAVQTVHCQNILGEGPIWHAEQQALYWVDIDGMKIQRFFPKNQAYQVYEMPKKVSAIAFRKKGGMVVAAADGFYFWDLERQEMALIADPEAGKTEGRFNDGKVDRKGRFWAGTMTCHGATSSLYRLSANLQVDRMIENVTISNGIGWSPDNRTMYYVDSKRFTVYAYRFNLASGKIWERRIFAQINVKVGTPDGLTVDREGFIWLAIYDGWKILRYHPSGKVDAEIHLPVSRPSSCAFGGEELDQLFITSASEGFSEEQRAQEPMAGDLFVVQTNTCGLPEPRFAG